MIGETLTAQLERGLLSFSSVEQILAGQEIEINGETVDINVAREELKRLIMEKAKIVRSIALTDDIPITVGAALIDYEKDVVVRTLYEEEASTLNVNYSYQMPDGSVQTVSWDDAETLDELIGRTDVTYLGSSSSTSITGTYYVFANNDGSFERVPQSQVDEYQNRTDGVLVTVPALLDPDGDANDPNNWAYSTEGSSVMQYYFNWLDILNGVVDRVSAGVDAKTCCPEPFQARKYRRPIF